VRLGGNTPPIATQGLMHRPIGLYRPRSTWRLILTFTLLTLPDPRSLAPNHNLARSANLPERLYILFALISSFFNLSQIMSGWTEPIFTLFSPNKRYLRDFSRSGPLFFRFLKGRCHGNQFRAKFAKWPLFNTLAFPNGFEYCNSDLQVLKGTIFATFYAILVKISLLTPEIMHGVSVPFGTRRLKST